jgi:hypothetical protein
VLTNSLTVFANIRLQTCDPTFRHFVYSPKIEFQNLMVLSAVPPPETSSPCWWGDHARALTAAVCLKRLKVGELECKLHKLSLLSLPPEASCCWSNDHFRPQTYCLWPTILLTKSSFVLISLIRIFLSLDPLAKTLFEFHPIAPTLAVWPLQVEIFFCLIQSQSYTSPIWVPTPKTLELGLEEQLVTKSLEASSTSRTTLEFPAFQR